MLRGFAGVLASALLTGAASPPEEVVIAVAPFAARSGEDAQIGKRTSAILNLQVWQTLRIPGTAEGKRTKGTVTWDLTSSPPSNLAEAEAYASAQTDPQPEVVLWGRAWRYGRGVVVESFLSIREVGAAAAPLWTVSSGGETFSLGLPRRQIEFAPIVIRSDLMPELADPAGLKLYASARGADILGPAGDSFRALEQGPESAKVILPDGRQGWIRLPDLSSERSEVVDFAGAIVRILRRDWPGATELLQRVVNNERAPTAVKVDSYLYLAVAAARSNGDPSNWIRRAYELNPYSRTVLQFLCMDQLSRGSNRTLQTLLADGKPLYSSDDPWFKRIGSYLAR